MKEKLGSDVGSGGSSQVGLMVTIALFLHKAPEAIGYGTFILHKKCSLAQRLTYIGVSS